MIGAAVIVRSNDCPRIAGRIDAGVDRALDRAVLTCIAVADPLTRRDTGALIGNKTIERGDDSRTITWNQDYSGFQNYGTVYMSGTHFAETGAAAGHEALQAGLRGIF